MAIDRIVDRAQGPVHEFQNDDTRVFELDDALMQETPPIGPGLDNVPDQPKEQVDEMAELRVQGAPVQQDPALPIRFPIIFRSPIPKTVKLDVKDPA